MKKKYIFFWKEKKPGRPNLDKWLKKACLRKWHLNLDLQDKEFTGRERGWKDFQAEARGLWYHFIVLMTFLDAYIIRY